MTRIPPFFADLFGTGVDLALRSAVVLLLATVATLLMRKSSAVARHLVWSTALVGVLLLPILVALVPLELALPNLSEQAPSAASPPPMQVPSGKLEMRMPVDADAPSIARMDSHTGGPRLELMDTAPPPGAPASDFRAAHLQSPDHTSDSQNTSGPRGFQFSENLLTGMIAIWMSGAVVMSLPLILGYLSLARLQKQSQPLSGSGATQLQELALRVLGHRRVIGLQSPARRMPMTWGVFQPIVLLPTEAQEWSTDRRRLVLLHELAHIRRLDCLTQIVGQVVRALHWFNPCAWWALARLQMEQEKACDDFVLNSGVAPDEYATELLAVAVRLPQTAWDTGLALAMSRAGRLEQRLSAILDDERNRKTPTRLRATLHLFLLCSVVITVAIFERREVAATPPALPQAPLENQAVTAPKRNVPSPSAQKPESTPAETPPATTPVAAAQGMPDRMEKLNAAIRQIETHSLIPVDQSALHEAAIRGIVDSLHDPYSSFVSAEQLRQLHDQINGQLVGIGAVLARIEKTIVVQAVLPGSPARAGGLLPGDEILEVDDREVTEVETTARSIRGVADTIVTLKLRRGGKDLLALKFTRGAVKLPTIRGLTINAQGEWLHWLDPNTKTAYIHLGSFNTTTATEFQTTLQILSEKGLKGLILDLRNCPGGLLPGCIDVAQLFLKDALIVQTRSRNTKEDFSYRTGPNAPYPDLPLIVLVDRQTASAAEVLTAALKDHQRAIVIGERTFGKGSVQAIFPLEVNGPALKLTTAKMVSPAGQLIHRDADSKTWGVDPHEDNFIALSTNQRTLLGMKQLERESGRVPMESPLTAEFIRTQLADPALAAGFESLQAKVQRGEFTKVGRPLAEQQTQLVLQEELRKKRDEMQQKLNEIKRELGELR